MFLFVLSHRRASLNTSPGEWMSVSVSLLEAGRPSCDSMWLPQASRQLPLQPRRLFERRCRAWDIKTSVEYTVLTLESLDKHSYHLQSQTFKMTRFVMSCLFLVITSQNVPKGTADQAWQRGDMDEYWSQSGRLAPWVQAHPHHHLHHLLLPSSSSIWTHPVLVHWGVVMS